MDLAMAVAQIAELKHNYRACVCMNTVFVCFISLFFCFRLRCCRYCPFFVSTLLFILHAMYATVITCVYLCFICSLMQIYTLFCLCVHISLSM